MKIRIELAMAVLKNPANLLTNCLNSPQDNLGLAFSGDC